MKEWLVNDKEKAIALLSSEYYMLKGDGDELSDQREVRVQASGFKSRLFGDDDEEDLMVENEVDCYLDRIRTPQANSMVAPFFSMVERS